MKILRYVQRCLIVTPLKCCRAVQLLLPIGYSAVQVMQPCLKVYLHMAGYLFRGFICFSDEIKIRLMCSISKINA
jgi:hypothetical protein